MSSNWRDELTQSLFALAGLLGVTSHLAYFIREERNGQVLQFLSAAVVLPQFLFLALYLSEATASVLSAIKLTTALLATFFLGLASSILIYRLFFHRLRAFPGPLGSRISKFYGSYETINCNWQYHYHIQRLHREHGDFVRTGPRELSICNVDAVQKLHSSKSKAAKGPFYDQAYPEFSVHTLRDRKDHAVRRRVWERAFGSKAVVDYQPRINHHAQNLLHHLAASAKSGTPVDISELFNFFTFDVMAELVLGRSFNLLLPPGAKAVEEVETEGEGWRNEKRKPKDYFMKMIHGTGVMVAVLRHVPYTMKALSLHPMAQRQVAELDRFTQDSVDWRKQREPEKPDLFSWLIQDFSLNGINNGVTLGGEIRTAIVAASDTTSAALTNIIFHLAANPPKLAILQAELGSDGENTDDPPPGDVEESSGGGLGGRYEYLEAVISEGLRLNPPVPSGTERETPPEGVTIGGRYIPGNTLVYIPNFTIHRDERYFERANEFIPERWTTQKEMVKDPKAYHPFGIGPWSCVGKPLALIEMRTMISWVARRFDMRLAEGESEERMMSRAEDYFLLTMGKVEILFFERK